MEQVRQRCSVCGREIAGDDGLPGELIRPALAELIRHDRPAWDGVGVVCNDDLHRYRLQLLGRQWSHLMEIQRIQTELMAEIATHRRAMEAESPAQEVT